MEIIKYNEYKSELLSALYKAEDILIEMHRIAKEESDKAEEESEKAQNLVYKAEKAGKPEEEIWDLDEESCRLSKVYNRLDDELEMLNDMKINLRELIENTIDASLETEQK